MVRPALHKQYMSCVLQNNLHKAKSKQTIGICNFPEENAGGISEETAVENHVLKILVSLACTITHSCESTVYVCGFLVFLVKRFLPHIRQAGIKRVSKKSSYLLII